MQDGQEKIQEDFTNGGDSILRDVDNGEMMDVVSFEDLMNSESPTLPDTEQPPAPTQEATQQEAPAQEPTQTEQQPEAQPIVDALPKVEFAPPPQKELTAEELVQRFQDKKALLKALGFDEFAIGAAEYYQQTGDMTPYLEAKTVDYSKLPDTEILKRSLREEVASFNLSEEEFDMLYNSRVLGKYKQDNPDNYSESEVKMGQLEMRLDAAKARQQFVERQAKFAPPPRQQQQEEQPEPSMEKMVAARHQQVLADPTIQQFTKSPILKIGEGEDAFNYQAKNPNALLSAMVDPQQTAYYTSKKDELGRIQVDANNNPIPDYDFLLELAAHMTAGKDYNRYLINHGKSLGTKSIAEEINPVPKLGSDGIPKSEPLSDMEELAVALRARGY